ncbi:MAG: ABC transporter ATP-binding protein [Candidatus Woesearchaeota archaeon]
MKNPIIKIENVWKIYKMGKVEVPALRGLTLQVFPGEFVAIIGSSGSGKSTTLNMVGCLDTPTKGHVYLDGKDISKLNENVLARIRGKKIGFVFQTFNLIPSLNAIENVTLPMIFQGIEEDKRVERAQQLLTLVGLEKRMHHKPSELSGGERQRVAIARALANDPEVVLADEPTGNLDSVTGKQIIQTLCRLHKEEKKTIILITHDLNIAKCAQRTIKLKDGRVTK